MQSLAWHGGVSECFVDCNVLDLRNPVPEKWHFWHGRVKFEGLVPVLTGFGHGGNAAERLFLGRFLMPDPLVQDPASTQNYRQLRTFGEYKYFPPDETALRQVLLGLCRPSTMYCKKYVIFVRINYMKKALRISFLLVAACLLLSGCVSKYKKISVSSFELESVVPTSLRSANVVVAVGISNPAPAFQVRDNEAPIKRGEVVMGVVTGEPVSVDGKCDRVYRIPLQAQLADGISLMQLLATYKSFNPEEFCLDLHARANVAGKIGKDIDYKDMPLTKFLKK